LYGSDIDSPDEEEVQFNNDFIGRNKNMLAFYREHDSEKRMAFGKLRDYFGMRAKNNKEAVLDEKRAKVMNYMGRWDEYRIQREQVIKLLLKKQQREN